MHRIVSFGKCFADPIAVRMMRVLLKKQCSIFDMQDILGLDRHTVDLRLNKLRDARIIAPYQQGKWLIYEVLPDARPLIEKLLTDFYEDVSWDRTCLRDDERIVTAVAR
jgi:DNA-binding transcriptional ArsR family regulator